MTNEAKCPKCGEPARVVVLIMVRVRCAVAEDGTAGKVLSVSKGQRGAVDGEVEAYECGGGHTWRVAE